MNNKCLIGILVCFSGISLLLMVFYENIANVYNVKICECNCESSSTDVLYVNSPDCDVMKANMTTQNGTSQTVGSSENKMRELKSFVEGLINSIAHLNEAKKSIKTGNKEKAYIDMVKAMSEVTKSYAVVDPVHSNYLIPDIKVQPNHKLVVCPEIFKGTKYGWPFYDKGFEIGECNDVEPLGSVVQILINTMEYPDTYAKNLVKILKGIEKAYPGLTVHVAAKTPLPTSTSFTKISVIMYTDLTGKPGHIWNFLISKVSTPYFLLAKDIYFFHWFARIERMLRIASAFNVKVVAGAGRDVEGHWRLSCHQQTLKNYTLRYIDGYDISRNACLVCDYAPGPFVAKTEFVKHISFDENLPDEVVFEDFFMRLKQVNVMVMTCPDSMYFMLTKDAKYNKKEAWLPLAKKWSLNRLHLHDGQKYHYNCEEAGITCVKTPGIATPPCCLELLAKTLHDVMKLCEESGAICELSTGQILGAIKFDGILPWTREDNIVYVSANHSVLQNMGAKINELGYKWSESDPKPECCEEGTQKMKGGHFDLESGVWRVGFSGKASLSTEKLQQNKMKPTKVNVNGVWIQGPHNPVRAARELYGSDVFKHNEEYDGNSVCKDKIGGFCRCPNPFHHACLQNFLGDGNIQFKIP